jgi:hypothetical protein
VAVVSAGSWLARHGRRGLAAAAPVAILLLAIGTYVAAEGDYLTTMTPRTLSRERYGSNPFIESVEIARVLAQRAAPGDRIAVLGSEPQIFFYSGLRSVTGYIYMYPLMEDQAFARRMQTDMIEQVEQGNPAFVVLANIPASWSAQGESGRRMLRWGQRYLSTCFVQVGLADIHSKDETTYVWDEAVASYRPRSRNTVVVFQRKSKDACRVGAD